MSWHIARTVPRMGDRALTALKEINVAMYQPRLSEVVVRYRLRVVRSTPLLLRTVFIGVRDRMHLSEAQAQAGIAEIVSHPEPEDGPAGNIASVVRRPARLDPAELQRLADTLAADMALIAALCWNCGTTPVRSVSRPPSKRYTDLPRG